MNRFLSIFIGLVFVKSSLMAQLANWSVVPAGTNFPTNVSGQINGMTRVCQMKFHTTNANKLYVVTAQGGFFTSTNQGTSWTVAPGTETLTSSCAAICVDYTNDQTIWLGTGDPNYYSNGQGIMKSINGGISFAATSLTNCLVVDILQNPTNSNEYVAATNKGIYKSTNAGVNWAATSATTIPFCNMVSNAAANSQTLYAASNENVPKFMRSTDFGTSWTQVTVGIVPSTNFVTSGARIAVTPADPNVVYFEVVGGGGIVHKSNNGGLSFNVKKPEGSPFITFYSNTVTSSSQGNYNNAITVDLADPAKVWLQSHNTWFSADSGATWSMLTFWSQKVHTDMHQVMKSPYDNTKLYSINDGGVWLSSDGGNNWTTKTDGIYAFEIGDECGIGSLTQNNFVSLGTQDNGRLYGNANGWFTNGGGDDYAKRQFDYNGNIYFDGTNRQINQTGASVSYGLPTTNWNSFGFNRTNPNLAFMGENDVYRSTNLSSSSPTWAAITNFSLAIKAVHSCIADPNRLYVLLSSGNMYVSYNALATAPTFSLFTIPGSANSVGSIAAMANNANIVYVSKNNAVYNSTDGGQTWTNVTYNLPNVNHRRVLAEAYGGTQELVFIATNNAVYYKKAGQTSWTNYSTNLPSRKSPTGFSMFDNGTNQARIRYSSYGRGIWESGFDNIRAFSAQILFTSDSSITCSNPAIQLADASVGTNNAPITYTWNFPGGTPATAFTSTASVSYTATGTYSISLTIKDALNNVSTKNITRYIQVISCNTDTIPHNAIAIDGGGNYAVSPPIALGNTNSITLSAWIKIEVAQPSFAGILFSASGSATGLNFRNGNQIGYHYNGLASTYNYAGGPTIPYSLWTHVALVTTANNSIIYVNGVPYQNNVANSPINFTSGFNLGNDRDNSARTMTGQMDEVCFYNRTLSQNEIRELMHLTKNHNVIDAGLVSYYQCNEVGNTIFDRAGATHAILQGSSSHTLSTAPVGSGSSLRMTINTSGVKTFTNEGLIMTFPNSTLPNGEICVTRLNIQPDSVPANNTFTNTAAKYWIVNNYGTSASFAALTTLSLTGYGNILPNEALAPRKFKLYKRVMGGYLKSSWLLNDSAYIATTGTNAALTYSGTANTFFNSQFTIVKRPCLAALPINPSVNTNPVCSNTNATLSIPSGSINDAATWNWYLGSCGGTLAGMGSSISITPTINTTYYVRGEGGCAGTSSCAAITVSVKTVPSNTAAISGSTLLCQGTNQIYSVTSIAGATSYSWTLPGGWTGASTTNTILVNAATTSGTLQIKALNNCGSSNAATKIITINPTVTAVQNKTLCSGQALTVGTSTYTSNGTYTNVLMNSLGCDSVLTTNLSFDPAIDVSTSTTAETISANALAANYQWINCDNNSSISSATNKTFTPLSNGNYAVIITINNCSDTSACVTISSTGLNKFFNSNRISIYPNPFTGKLIIESTLKSGTIILSNAIGQQLLLKQITNQREVLDVSNYANGIYFIKISNADGSYTQKVMKE
jgi:hypothetical protein